MDRDDWRVTISFPDSAQARQARTLFSRHKVAEDASRQLGHNIAVGAGPAQIFLYAGTEAAAREAERIARDMLAQHDLQAEFAIHRWHPVEEHWENPDVAMPRTEAERQAEHQQLLNDETADSQAAGAAEWLVRAELPSRHEAVALASELRGEGRGVVRRWKFLDIGASNEDDARELARRIQEESSPGATVSTRHSAVYLPFAGF